MTSISGGISDIFRSHGYVSRTVKLGNTDATASNFIHNSKLPLVDKDSLLRVYPAWHMSTTYGVRCDTYIVGDKTEAFSLTQQELIRGCCLPTNSVSEWCFP